LLAFAEGKDGFAQVVFRVGSGSVPDASALKTAMLQRPVVTGTDPVAVEQVQLPVKNPDVTHDLNIEGPVGKYTWTINGKTYNPAEGLPVRQGQRVRLRFGNKTEMFHPMHLHGHTFQVRGAGGTGPRKDTVIVLPKQTLEVDFDANNPGQWLTHCHNVYHGEAGMMTVVSYVE
jgi:FtsP/CotA-like multicopper oxidase with cupredoxin domain